MSLPKVALCTFEGHRNFRLRLVLATLSGRPIKIVKVRSDEMNPGLKDYEVSFLRLLEAITNGSHIEISYTGTTVVYRPGIIIGGQLVHNCPPSRAVGYFIEPILYLAPFSKKKVSITFKGLTSSLSTGDAGYEALKWGLLPIIEKFGVREISLHIIKRGSPPNGEGEVQLTCNTLILQPLTLHAIDTQKFSSIRGVAYCTRVSPSVVNRMIDAARAVLRPTGVEVNITADVWRGENAGKSPGFGITLVAELKKGWRIFSEGVGEAASLPEDLGKRVAYQLLEELTRSCVVGRNQLALCLVYMTIGKEDIGRIKLHKEQIDENLVWTLRDIHNVFGTEVFLKEGLNELELEEDKYLTATVKGIGFFNAAKKTT